MIKLDAGDIFRTVRNAQKAGILELLPLMQGRIAPGERFFESIQSALLEYVDLERLDEVLYSLAPVFRYMADEQHWEPAAFTSGELFRAVRNLQEMEALAVWRGCLPLPGSGDRYFEHYQAILVERIGTAALDRLLHTLGQCIKFLAADAAMVQVKTKVGGKPCA